MKAQKCPVCDGEGVYNFYGTMPDRTCHGCDGKGLIILPVVREAAANLDERCKCVKQEFDYLDIVVIALILAAIAIIFSMVAMVAVFG